MFPPLGSQGRGSHINILLAVLLVSLADVNLRMRCYAVLTTPTPTTLGMAGTSTTVPANSSLQQLAPTTTTKNSLGTSADHGSYRLPTSLMPVHYHVELQPYLNYPDPANFTFRGRVVITMRCDKTTNKIILHKDILTVDNSSVRIRTMTAPIYWVNVTSVEEDLERQFLIVTPSNNMEAGVHYGIDILFTSPLKNDGFGLYYSNSTRGNKTVYTVASFLEPVYARRVFPCFDEPAMKAKFTIIILRPVDRISLSNMPIAYSNFTITENGVKYVEDVYQLTPLMSTYMLAFAVCDFDHLSKKTKNNITYSTWAKPADLNKTQYALDIAVKTHDFFEDYFDIKYQLPKQDMIAIANSAAAAMENWGLIIYREWLMFYEPGVTTEWLWRIVTDTVAHEIAHMWLGNLVTLKWWNEVWIKEGFTSYFATIAVENVTDSWKMFDHFILVRQQVGFRLDHAADSRPLYVEELKSTDLKTLITYFYYSKGAAVARMLNFVLGDSTFQKAFRNFLKWRLYATFDQQDLYMEMTQQARDDGLDIDVKEFLDTWVLQGNFPVVTVTQDARNKRQLHVAQQRFLQDPTDKGTGKFISPFNFRWNIPLTFASSKHAVFNHTFKDVYWLKRDEPAKTISVKFLLPNCTSPSGWILANINWYGFYRVNYHIGNWLALCRQLKINHSVIPTINRAQIIDDAFSLYKANYIPLDTALTTLEYLHREREALPWTVAFNEFTPIGQNLAFTPLYKPFETFIRRKLTPAFRDNSLRNISENINVRKLHTILASSACQYGVKLCLEQVREMYGTAMSSDGTSYVHPDVKLSVYCYGVATGSLKEWQFALKMYDQATVCAVKHTMIAAMACATRPHVLKRYLALVLNETIFSKEDALRVLINVIARPEGRAIAWDFYVKNFNALRDRCNKTFGCSAALPRLTADFNRQKELDNVTAFWASQCDGYKQNDFEKAVLSPIKKNIAWLVKYSPVIKAWLSKKGIQT